MRHTTRFGSTQITSRRGMLAATVSLLSVVGLAALSGCAAPGPTLVPSDEGVEPAVVVQAIDNAYEPKEVTIKVGQAVRWEFGGVNEHDVVSDDRSFVSKLGHGGTYTHVFKDAGDFAYLCSIHPEMRGMVKVVK